MNKAGQELADAIDETALAMTSGAAEPPKDKPPVAAQAAPPANTNCPHTNTICTEGCVLPAMTGSTYCVRWVAQVRKDAIESKSK